MRAYSMDFRERVAAARDGGMTTTEVAEAFGCCASWVRRLMQRRRDGGSLQPLKRKQVDQRRIDGQERQRLRGPATSSRSSPSSRSSSSAARFSP